MLLRAQWLAAITKRRGCYKCATARPSSKQTVGGSEINSRSPTLKIEENSQLKIYVRLSFILVSVLCLWYISLIFLNIKWFTHTVYIQTPLFVFRIIRYFRLRDCHCARFSSDNRDSMGSKTEYVQRLTLQVYCCRSISVP